MRFNPFVPHGPEPITPTPKSGGFVPSVVEFFKKRIDELFRRDSASVHYTPEEKTGEEKTIARGNIGAQETLVSGVNLKTVGGQSLLGGGDVPVEPPVWGGITGNLGDQGDLAETLSGKADRSETYTKAETDAEITANVEDSVTSVSATKALSARMGRELQDQIQNLKQRGRYLSIWDCTTGLAKTEPTVNPYEYKAGDYFIVGTVGTVNYRPSGTQYDKTVPSTVAETGTPIVNDIYYYDGSSWSLLHTEQSEISWGSVAGKPDWVDSDTKPTYTAGEVGVSLSAGSQSVALAVGGTSAVMPTSEFMALLNSYKLDKADVVDPASATGAGKAADALATKNALAGVITADDVKRVYNSNNTQYIDGDGDVYTAQFVEGGYWTLTQGQNVYRLDYKGIQTGMTGSPYKWATANGYQFVYYRPGDGKIIINGYYAETEAAPGLNPTNGDDIPGTFVYSNWRGVFTKQSSVFPETPNDTVARVSALDGKLDKTDVLKQSEVTDSTPYGKAADAKDLKEALAGVITEDDVKRVYNSNNTQYIDGNGDVYTSYFEQGGHWNMTWSAGDVNLYYIGYETSLSSYRWRDPNNYNRIVTYNPSSGRVGASGSSVDTGRKSLNPENGDDIGGPYVISGATLTFFKQSSVFPETPSDSVVKKSDVVAPTGSATIDTSKAAQAESTRVALGGKLDKTDGGVVTGDLELDGEVVINGNVRADTDVQINGNLSVNSDYTADFDKLKINGYYLTAYVDGEERWFDFPAKDGTFAVEEDFSTTAPADYVADYTKKAVRYQEVTPANTALSEAAINILTTAGQTYTLPTLAAGEKRVRDLLLYVNTTAAAFAINFPSGTQLLGDNPSITEAGEYIITMTAMPSGKWYVRKIKMEAAQ